MDIEMELDLGGPVEAEPGQERRLLGLLALMVGMGLSNDVCGVLAEMGGLDLGKADERRWLLGPVVVHAAGGWEKDLPKWMRERAIAERWEIVSGRWPGHIVGPTELAAVMYAATMVAPMRSEYAELYCWAVGHAMHQHEPKRFPTPYSAQKGNGWIVEDKAVIERGGRYWDTYWPLAQEIRRKVAAACKAGEAELARAERLEKPKKLPAPKVEREQFAMFG